MFRGLRIGTPDRLHGDVLAMDRHCVGRVAVRGSPRLIPLAGSAFLSLRLAYAFLPNHCLSSENKRTPDSDYFSSIRVNPRSLETIRERLFRSVILRGHGSLRQAQSFRYLLVCQPSLPHPKDLLVNKLDFLNAAVQLCPELQIARLFLGSRRRIGEFAHDLIFIIGISRLLENFEFSTMLSQTAFCLVLDDDPQVGAELVLGRSTKTFQAAV